MSRKPLAAIVLAAGEGKRMGGGVPKVLVEACGRPLVEWVLDALAPLEPDPTVIVHGFAGDRVRVALDGRGLRFAHQEEQNGTGHAVRCAMPSLDGFAGDVLVVCGDTPLLSSEVLAALIEDHRAGRRALTLLTATVEEPGSLGRILRDAGGRLTGIRETADASEVEKAISEVSTGVLVADMAVLRPALEKLKADNAQGEYYLTDVPGVMLDEGLAVDAYRTATAAAAMGVNDLNDLALAEKLLRTRSVDA